MIKLGATGNVIKGDVLDVSQAALERMLRDYDSQLYVRWNPKKRRGYGAWEVRRRPEKKTAVYKGDYQGMSLISLEYVEHDMVHHVMDVPHLSYEILTRLKATDTWKTKNWVDVMERAEQAHQDRGHAKARAEMLYSARHNSTAFSDLREAISQGVNPALLAKHWGR